MFGLSDSAGDDAYAAGSHAAAAGHGAVPSANDDVAAAPSPADTSNPSHVVLSFEGEEAPFRPLVHMCTDYAATRG